jgi:hypothetical protein
MGRTQFLFLVVCVAAGLRPMLLGSMPGEVPELKYPFPGWPASFEGAPLVPRELSAREAGFARSFPGRLGVFENGDRLVILRWVTGPTRKLHSSADCLRALGYGIEPRTLFATGEGAENETWGRFTARRDGSAWEVRERIYEADGRTGGWSDVSAWYWSAALGSSEGPWWAVTVFE